MKQSIDVISNRRNELRQKVGRCGIYGSRGELSSFSIPELSFTGTNDGEFGTLDRFDLTSLLEQVYLTVFFVFAFDEVKRAVSHSFDLYFLYVAFLVTDFVEELPSFSTTHLFGSVCSRYGAWTATPPSSFGIKLGNRQSHASDFRSTTRQCLDSTGRRLCGNL